MDSIYNFTLNELEKLLITKNIKKSYAAKIFDLIYIQKQTDFSFLKIVNIKLINQLKELFYFESFNIKTKLVDKVDNTIKFLFELNDLNCIETVLMEFDYGFSVCISTQVGCNLGCKFCASGLLKLKRNLTTSELVYQVLYLAKYVNQKFNKTLKQVVVMGIGEPLANFNNLVKFIRIITNQKGLNITPSKITVSTCGLVKQIKELADLNLKINLAVSLHASNNITRNKIMPINQVYDINKLLSAIDYYINKTNKRVEIAYLLLKNVNDSIQNALELVNLLKGKLCYVNLISYNIVDENNYNISDNVNIFYQTLKQNQIQTTIRVNKGTNIAAACGQLRSKRNKNVPI